MRPLLAILCLAAGIIAGANASVKSGTILPFFAHVFIGIVGAALVLPGKGR